jgi:hypothetical protein
MRQAQFPDGDVVVIATGMTFTVNGTQVAANLAGGIVKQYTAKTPAGALSLQAQLQGIPDTADGTTTVLKDLFPLALISVSPNPFNPTTTSPLTVRGTGFTPNVGLLHVEDAGGGTDSNGYYMVATYVNDTTLTCVPGGSGDAGLPALGALVYYIDGAGNQSNSLTGTVDGSLNVTMDAPAVVSQPGSPGGLSYAATPIGSDNNAANANINGSVVTISGLGFKGRHGAWLVNAATPTDRIPVTFLGSAAIQAQLPAYSAGSQTFNYEYLADDGSTKTQANFITITFS